MNFQVSVLFSAASLFMAFSSVNGQNWTSIALNDLPITEEDMKEAMTRYMNEYFGGVGDTRQRTISDMLWAEYQQEDTSLYRFHMGVSFNGELELCYVTARLNLTRSPVFTERIGDTTCTELTGD